jgi:hypothetical protein
MGFNITGTPKQGDIVKVAGNLDDVLAPRDQQVVVQAPQAPAPDPINVTPDKD